MKKHKNVPEVSSKVDTRSTLDAVAREGAQRMLQQVLELEVDEFLERH